MKADNFRIEPSIGTFPPSRVTEFNVKFKANTPMPYYQFCSLIVDDIPLKSIVAPPTAMQGKED